MATKRIIERNFIMDTKGINRCLKQAATRNQPTTDIPDWLWKEHDIDPPVREFKFCEDRKWMFDFAWPKKMVAVEIEGGVWAKNSKSRHTTGTGFANDCEKYNWATVAGWKVLRYIPNKGTISGAEFEQIWVALCSLQ
jgi:hypothetical protein